MTSRSVDKSLKDALYSTKEFAPVNFLGFKIEFDGNN